MKHRFLSAVLVAALASLFGISAQAQSFLIEQTSPKTSQGKSITIQPYRAPVPGQLKTTNKPVAGPWSVTETHKSWALECRTKPSKCRMKHIKKADGKNNKTPFSITIETVKLPKQKRLAKLAIIRTPLNLLLPAGLGWKIDKSKSVKLAIRSCHVEMAANRRNLVTACLAPVQLTAKLIRALRRGTTLKLSAKTLSGKSISQVISLSGFTGISKKLK